MNKRTLIKKGVKNKTDMSFNPEYNFKPIDVNCDLPEFDFNFDLPEFDFNIDIPEFDFNFDLPEFDFE